ncbi:MAG: cyclic nucleotide-binding domain-containing protein [Cellvibrionaceae bacterium]
MNTREITTLPSETIEKLLRAIPFYKAVKKQNEGQYQELLQYSKIFQFGSNEQILTRGQVDSWSYFLVKGQLVVSLPDHLGRPLHVNYVTPGEVFGDLAVLLKTPRTADVHVDENCREAIVFGTDFSLFGQLLNFNIVSLETKLIYYRHTVQSLRWKLEMYRSKYRDNPLADKHRAIKLYVGTKDSMDELHALHQQSVDFSKLLVEWNQAFGNLSVVEGKVPEPNIAI